MVIVSCNSHADESRERGRYSPKKFNSREKRRKVLHMLLIESQKEDDMVFKMLQNMEEEIPKGKGSKPGKKPNVCRNRTVGHDTRTFRRRYRMDRDVFQRIHSTE